MRIAVPIVIVISTRVVFLRVWRHLLHFSTNTGTRKINGGRKFSEIKVQKTSVLMFVIYWNLARSFGKTYCARKCKKNGYRQFDLSGTLTKTASAQGASLRHHAYRPFLAPITGLGCSKAGWRYPPFELPEPDRAQKFSFQTKWNRRKL